jgi:hypothetical protein
MYGAGSCQHPANTVKSREGNGFKRKVAFVINENTVLCDMLQMPSC